MVSPTSISYHGGSLSKRYLLQATLNTGDVEPRSVVALDLTPGVVVTFDAGLSI